MHFVIIFFLHLIPASLVPHLITLCCIRFECVCKCDNFVLLWITVITLQTSGILWLYRTLTAVSHFVWWYLICKCLYDMKIKYSLCPSCNFFLPLRFCHSYCNMFLGQCFSQSDLQNTIFLINFIQRSCHINCSLWLSRLLWWRRLCLCVISKVFIPHKNCMSACL